MYKKTVYLLAGVVIAAALFMSACEQPVGKGNGELPDEPQVEIPAAPEKPEILVGDGFLGLTWKKVPGAESYSVYYGTNASFTSLKTGKWNGEMTEGAETYSTLITGLDNGERYYVWITASNTAGESGYSERVSEKPVATVYDFPLLYFDYGRKIASYDNPEAVGTYTVPHGKTFILTPVTGWQTSAGAVYEWKVDDAAQNTVSGSGGEYFSFTPSSQGEYTVQVKVTDGERVEEAVTLVQCTAAEGTYKRAKTGDSAAKALNCFDFMPAPGQFVSGTVFPSDATATTESVTAYAQGVVTRAGAGWAFSLGSFGGYVITGFDHSVDNSDGDDFSIKGNAFGTWEEPAVVWVSQDENGNGQADDTWYELKGSQTDAGTAAQRYAVTWFKPQSGSSGIWKDNRGNTGTYPRGFPYLKDMNYFTLVGTKLTNSMDNNWGYVDIVRLERFDISNAIRIDGSDADLPYIDFVKVQCGLHDMAGVSGEISTETGVPFDLHIPNPALLIEGAAAAGGKYTYRFLNTSGYDLTITVEGQTLDLSRNAPDQTVTLDKALVYFDYYGGNVTFTSAPGLVTFSM
jgi:hypothetical protein